MDKLNTQKRSNSSLLRSLPCFFFAISEKDSIDYDMSTGFLSDPAFKKCFKALVSYMGYFGSRYVGNDIQLLCGNILDHPVVKTFTLFCVMYQATDNFDIALIMTIVFLILQYVMSITSICTKYVEKISTNRHVQTYGTAWPHDKDLTMLNISKKK